MSDLQSLPPDQRAVLQLVLQRGRSFDQIAKLLAIDRRAVRGRALAALDRLGPQTELAPERRALIGDYLLGQLPPRVVELVREQLARSPADRAWARMLAAELAPLAASPLPDIPESQAMPEPAAAATPEPAAAATPEPAAAATPEPAAAATPEPQTPAAVSQPPATRDTSDPDRGRADLPRRPAFRRGSAILIGAGAIAVIALAVVVIVLLAGSGPGSTGASRLAAKRPAGTAPASRAPGATTGAGSVTPLAQIRLTAPNGGRASGVAEIVRQAGRLAVVIEARGVPPNSTHNAYAVWLSNGAGRYDRLGFVNPPVNGNGVLQTAGALPSDAARYDQLMISLESTRNPAAPSSQVVLRGSFKLPG